LTLVRAIDTLRAQPVYFLPTFSCDTRKGGCLTSPSPSRDEGSFCKTAMSRREDIVSCIDVTIMDRFARSALPSPYSKVFLRQYLPKGEELSDYSQERLMR